MSFIFSSTGFCGFFQFETTVNLHNIVRNVSRSEHVTIKSEYDEKQLIYLDKSIPKSALYCFTKHIRDIHYRKRNTDTDYRIIEISKNSASTVTSKVTMKY